MNPRWSTKRKLVIAAVFSAAVVIIAKVALSYDLHPAELLLLPGSFINLMIYGVHSSWDSPLAKSISVSASTAGWFAAMYFALSAYDVFFPRKFPAQKAPN